MRTTFFKAFNLLLVSFGLWAYNARACDVFFDFNGVDPQTLIPPPYDQFGNAGWVDNGDGTGFLRLTDAGNGQVSVVVFHDCDNGAIIGSFAIDMDIRLGGGTSRPADGMSINYARAGDPIFTKAPTHVNDDYGFACTPAGECGGYEAEEGTTTGLSVALDEWQSGAVSQGDVIGITIRVDGNIIANYPYPTLNGDSTDLTSLQTYDGYLTAPPGVGQFVPLHAEVTKDGHVIVRYKLNPDGTQHEVTPAGGLATTFGASPAALVMGGRTGGANSNDHVDNIHIVTTVTDRTIWGPIINITPVQITFEIFDSPTVTFDPTSALAITLDGNPVTPDAGSVVKNGATTTGTSTRWLGLGRPRMEGMMVARIISSSPLTPRFRPVMPPARMWIRRPIRLASKCASISSRFRRGVIRAAIPMATEKWKINWPTTSSIRRPACPTTIRLT